MLTRRPIPIASTARRTVNEWRATLRRVDRHIDGFWVVSVTGCTIGTTLVTTSYGIAPRSSGFYDTLATVAAAALIAVAIDNRNIAPPTLSTPRQTAGLLLGLSFGLLVSIVGALVAIGLEHGTPVLFGIVAGSGGFAILMLLLAVTLRAANYGLTSEGGSDDVRSRAD